MVERIPKVYILRRNVDNTIVFITNNVNYYFTYRSNELIFKSLIN